MHILKYMIWALGLTLGIYFISNDIHPLEELLGILLIVIGQSFFFYPEDKDE